MNLETIRMYIGFIFWIALAWVVIGAMVRLGAQFLWSVREKYGEYKRIIKMLDFLDENKGCNEQFEDWLAKRDDETIRTIRIWRMLRRLMRGRDGRES